MKKTLELLQQLTIKFPPSKNCKHSFTLSDDKLCLLLTLMINNSSYYFSFELENFDPVISDIIYEISKQIKS